MAELFETLCRSGQSHLSSQLDFDTSVLFRAANTAQLNLEKRARYIWLKTGQATLWLRMETRFRTVLGLFCSVAEWLKLRREL